MIAVFCTLSGVQSRSEFQEKKPAVGVDAALTQSLARGLAEQHDSLTALSLSYQQVPSGRSVEPPGAYVRRFLAVSREGFFLRDNAHGNDGIPWLDDPFRKTLLITPTEAVLQENLNRVVTHLDIVQSGTAPHEIENELIFLALCWWPYSNWSPPEIYGRPWSMSSLLKTGIYVPRPRKESLESRPCHVLEAKDVDVIWIDCERPRCVLRREVYNPSTRSISGRYEMTEYREVSAGIWLPSRLRNIQYDSNAPTPSLRARVVIDATFLIHEIRVNSAVTLDTFRLDLSPGTIRRVHANEEDRFESIRDGQAEHFRSILNWCRTYALKPVAKAGRMPSRIWLFASIGILAGALVVTLSRASWARRHRASPPT